MGIYVIYAAICVICGKQILAKILLNEGKNKMEPRDIIYDQRTFYKKSVTCPKCNWQGTGSQTNVADFYGIGKFQQVSCPKCGEYLGNLSRDRLFGEDGDKRDSRKGPG